MVVVLKKSFLTLMMFFLAVWAIHYGISWRTAQNQRYAHSRPEKFAASDFVEPVYQSGLKALYENDLNSASDYFRKALSRRLLFIDAWLKLAQVESARRNTKAAEEILKFTDDLTRNIVQWKWAQILLARELKLEEIFWECINFVVPHGPFQNEALYLSDMHLDGDTTAVLNFLEKGNLSYYLQWLMKWKRTEDTFRVWSAIEEKQIADDVLYDRYINFLISQKEFRRATEIHEKYGSNNGMTNSGFELPLSNSGFGWRSRSGSHWDIQRVGSDAIEGRYALQVVFRGEENINFQHLSQIVPVLPEKTYHISFWWQSKDLTTDQRPFIEIRGMDCTNSYWKSDMVPMNTDWKQEIILFSIPESCYAVAVNLRRNPSHRFDSKIQGRLWLDHFQIKIVDYLPMVSDN